MCVKIVVEQIDKIRIHTTDKNYYIKIKFTEVNWSVVMQENIFNPYELYTKVFRSKGHDICNLGSYGGKRANNKANGAKC